MRVIFATCSASEAETLAERLLEERLIGCANLIPGVRSLYRWQGELQRDEEVVMWMETTEGLAEAAARRLRELHSYDVPKIVTLDPAACDPAYQEWLDEVTGA
ncbi:MAG: divalent-cation tolerance protein CutA [Deltaproteobacteria bacterium]|nr:divalent-cation tolerance protein CutA [Deltaproteobacteria bacterium]MBW2383253.1 divalent-cation tolerance protein CutA [Deltaproteobacteria bacterium]MBW2694987.1 divalent-cation tolerance protein CutA [Deltaproteobacteria bacterium]